MEEGVAGVTDLSISSLIFIWSRLHDRWDDLLHVTSPIRGPPLPCKQASLSKFFRGKGGRGRKAQFFVFEVSTRKIVCIVYSHLDHMIERATFLGSWLWIFAAYYWLYRNNFYFFVYNTNIWLCSILGENHKFLYLKNRVTQSSSWRKERRDG